MQPQHRTFSEIRVYMLQLADVYVGDVCTVTPCVSTHTNTPTATEATTPIPMDVSQMNSNVSKTETDEQESDCCQNEQDQECDGDEVFAVKAKGKIPKEHVSNAGMRGPEADRCWQKTGRQDKMDQKERAGPKEHGHTLVTRGKIPGIVPSGRAKRMVLRWIRDQLLNLLHISVQSI